MNFRLRSSNSRRGVSLLELMLALAISVIVLGLVGMALRVHLRTFENRRDRVEQAQLARAILRQISDDLRSSVVYREVEMDGVNTVSSTAQASTALAGMASGASAGATGSNSSTPASGSTSTPNANSSTTPGTGASPMNGGAASGASGSTNSPVAGETQSSDAATTASAGPAYSAGLYGDAYSIQFDMSRLPRLDEYSTLVTMDNLQSVTKIPTDVRTVSYYLEGADLTSVSAAAMPDQGSLPGAPAGGLGYTPSIPQASERRGLFRSENDRSVASFDSTSTTSAAGLSVDQGEHKIADEVTRLEFQYFDGYSWSPSWDSDTRGGLPMAIEILLGLMDGEAPEGESTEVITGTTDPSAPKEFLYRLVVRIPTAEPLDPNALPEEEATTDPAAQQNANTNNANTSQPTDPSAQSNPATSGAATTPGAAIPTSPGGGNGGGRNGGGRGDDGGGGRNGGGRNGGDNGGGGGPRGNNGGGGGPRGNGGGPGGGGGPRGGGR